MEYIACSSFPDISFIFSTAALSISDLVISAISETTSSSDSTSSWLTALPFSTFVLPSDATSIESPLSALLVFGAGLVASPAFFAASESFFGSSASGLDIAAGAESPFPGTLC